MLAARASSGEASSGCVGGRPADFEPERNASEAAVFSCGSGRVGGAEYTGASTASGSGTGGRGAKGGGRAARPSAEARRPTAGSVGRPTGRIVRGGGGGSSLLGSSLGGAGNLRMGREGESTVGGVCGGVEGDEGSPGGVGSGGRPLSVPDLPRERSDPEGDRLGAAPSNGEEDVTGGTGSLRGDMGCGEMSPPDRLATDGGRRSSLSTGEEVTWIGLGFSWARGKDFMTISRRSACVCFGLRRGVKTVPNTLSCKAAWLSVGLRLGWTDGLDEEEETALCTGIASYFSAAACGYISK